ncbi:MAG TPA: hypothetical protein VFH27_12925 [Longimicrobiaceae bacterium]|nr:hypothetical protein [Longimicrobiaceae bacterium]
MRGSDAFEPAWRAWMHTPAPVASARRGDARAPAYEAELVMDQLASHVYSLGLAFQAGERLDYEAVAADRLRNLHGAETLLDEADLTESRRRPYLRWMEATRALLHVIAAAR